MDTPSRCQPRLGAGRSRCSPRPWRVVFLWKAEDPALTSVMRTRPEGKDIAGQGRRAIIAAWLIRMPCSDLGGRRQTAGSAPFEFRW